MKTYSKDLRQKIIETKLEADESDQKIAARFRVSRSFVNKIVRQYSRCGNYEALPHGGGAQPKLGKEEIALVIELVEEDNDATLEQLSTRLEERTGIKVSVSTLCRLLQRLKLTRKKKTLHATEAQSERVQNLRKEYWTTIGEVKLSDLVFIDETGVNLAMTLGYGRAIKGKRAYNNCPFNRGRNVTLIGAIALSGLIASF